jgi:copper homeostasis protein (lipoprotein)
MPSGEGSADLDRSPLGVFEGTLPCADCEGIRTELTLFLQPDTFMLRETRLGGRGDGETIMSEGPWRAALGMEKDPEATVIQLDPEKPDTMRSFREVGGDRLEPLDRNGQSIESKQDHALKRKAE